MSWQQNIAQTDMECLCGQEIPKGQRYWIDEDGEIACQDCIDELEAQALSQEE